MVYTKIERKKRDKGDPPVESQGSAWTPLLSKLFSQEPRCVWIQT